MPVAEKVYSSAVTVTRVPADNGSNDHVIVISPDEVDKLLSCSAHTEPPCAPRPNSGATIVLTSGPQQAHGGPTGWVSCDPVDVSSPTRKAKRSEWQTSSES
jgi:hypothetical protein